jgi:lipoprotein-anchoring transpeptidase ErfK/SrfK
LLRLGPKSPDSLPYLVNAYLACNTKYGMTKDSEMVRVVGREASGRSGRFWRVAALTAASAIGSVSHAEAAFFYWDSNPGYYRPGSFFPHRRQKARHHQAKKIEVPEKESAKPQGPLIIAISIEKQSLKIYDANGFFAETPISTGMKGHPTPMGVFSVIQKQKLHHSNIYSGAPMPYMQRITWSGVAIHAGVLPGYPASHGCIRMPTAFAVKMWNWTKMGARVVITPGEMTPASFSHPLLVAQRVVPRPAADEPQADAPAATKSDKASDAGTSAPPAISEAKLELRSTVGHDLGVKSIIGEPSAPMSLREQTHTADASGDLSATKSQVTMTDASPSGGSGSPREEPAARTDSAPSNPEDATSVKAAEASKPDAKPEAVKSEAEPATVKPGETAAAEAKPSEPATAETTATGSLKAGANASEKKIEAKGEAKSDDVRTEAPRPDASAKAVTDISTSAPAKKDQGRLPDAEKPAASKHDPVKAAAPKRTGQIAVFISRKDSKLYVRQNFAPLFDVPVTIAPSDRPLGTHVFTAQLDKDDANLVHWSVVSLPVPVRYAERRDEDERSSRRRKTAVAVETRPMPVPDSPAEALDRLAIPADAMTRITEALSTGGSIIVSDQGINQGETGEGTDFIVSLR